MMAEDKKSALVTARRSTNKHQQCTPEVGSHKEMVIAGGFIAAITLMVYAAFYVGYCIRFGGWPWM
ncbi:MAG: hypothetical protein RR619_01405 [Raoultibacter sp.]